MPPAIVTLSLLMVRACDSLSGWPTMGLSAANVYSIPSRPARLATSLTSSTVNELWLGDDNVPAAIFPVAFTRMSRERSPLGSSLKMALTEGVIDRGIVFVVCA